MEITIIGTGNVGWHLAHNIKLHGYKVDRIISRKLSNAKTLAEEIGAEFSDNFSLINFNSLLLFTTPDDVTRALINDLPVKSRIAYTSGSLPLTSFATKRNIGVFYPLQTFSKGKSIDLSVVPILLESENQSFYSELEGLAKALSNTVIAADSDMRKKLHLAAVWLNNFTNHMVMQSQKYCESNDLNFEYLKPLLQETFNKLEIVHALEAQTGPARRGDYQTIESHLAQMDSQTKELYVAITNSILKTYGNQEL